MVNQKKEITSLFNPASTQALEVEEKEELKNLLKWGKFSFYVIIDCEIFTDLKNKKQLILIVNKKQGRLILRG